MTDPITDMRRAIDRVFTEPRRRPTMAIMNPKAVSVLFGISIEQARVVLRLPEGSNKSAMVELR